MFYPWVLIKRPMLGEFIVLLVLTDTVIVLSYDLESHPPSQDLRYFWVDVIPTHP